VAGQGGPSRGPIDSGQGEISEPPRSAARLERPRLAQQGGEPVATTQHRFVGSLVVTVRRPKFSTCDCNSENCICAIAIRRTAFVRWSFGPIACMRLSCRRALMRPFGELHLCGCNSADYIWHLCYCNLAYCICAIAKKNLHVCDDRVGVHFGGRSSRRALRRALRRPPSLPRPHSSRFCSKQGLNLSLDCGRAPPLLPFWLDRRYLRALAAWQPQQQLFPLHPHPC